MLKPTAPKFLIQRNKIDRSELGGFGYLLIGINDTNLYRRGAYPVEWVMKQGKDFGIQETVDKFAELGVGSEDLVADLNVFFPFSECPKYKGRGIASTVFDTVERDAKHQGAKVMHIASTGNPGMVSLMERKNCVIYSPTLEERSKNPFRTAYKLL
jgi:GNAT superfamily N-acetyltransferase|tara:strand:+ start:749 stop:1216 length:468 start_codon:yes stop_codon:yes gene_type:complete